MQRIPATTPADLMHRPRDLEADPVRLVLVVRRVEDGRYLLARWPEAPHGAMLGLDPPHPDEGLAEGIAAMLRARFDVEVHGEPRTGQEPRPVHMHHPYTGRNSVGWLLPVAVEVAGDPVPDALLDDVLALPRAEAEAALGTDLERALFRAGAALLEPAVET